MNWRFELLTKPLGGVAEGPIWDGEQLLFTHIPASRILRIDPRTDQITTWREGTNRTNGLAHDAQGRLFGCCSGGRAIVRFDPDGTTATIADRCDGQPLNTPNDLAVDAQGRIWFTNPWNAGNIDADEIEIPGLRCVMRADPQPDGSYAVTRVEHDSTMPNGVLVSIDGKTLYSSRKQQRRPVHQPRTPRLPHQRRRLPRPLRHAPRLRQRRAQPPAGHRRNVPRPRRQHHRHRRLALLRPRPANLRLRPQRAGHRNPPRPLHPPHQLRLRRPRPLHPIRNLRRGPHIQSPNRYGRLGPIPLTPKQTPPPREQNPPSEKIPYPIRKFPPP